jgi:hypothetical protein
MPRVRLLVVRPAPLLRPRPLDRLPVDPLLPVD